MVMEFFLGDKNNFAIEYTVESEVPSLMGKIRIWLGGRYVGSYEETNILSVTLYQLERIVPELVKNEAFKGMAEKDVYQAIKSGDMEDNGKYLLSLGESFDDFSVIVYFDDKNFTFVWRLHKDPYFDYPDYPEGLLFKKVSVSSFSNVVSEFGESLRR